MGIFLIFKSLSFIFINYFRMHFCFRAFLFTCFFSGAVTANSQSLILSESESKQAIKNLEEILAGGKAGFYPLKTNVKTNVSRVDSSFKSRLSILPAKTKSASHIYFYKKFVYYFEEAETGIYTITQALKPLLTADDFTEIYPDQQGTYTLTARAFATPNAIIEISYKTEKDRKYSTIMVVKKDEYSDKPLKPLVNNWEAEKKSLGFIYRTNGKDSVLVTEVLANSPAYAAGLKTGDLISTINKTTTKDKSLTEVAKIFAKADGKIEVGFNRNGKNQTVMMQKDWRYKFDKTCLSGDCVNGKGVAMSKVTSGLLMEGKFSEGQLEDGDWYLNAKSAQDKGLLVRRGKVLFDRFFSGSSYDGSKPDGGWWYQVVNHDLIQNSSITEKTLNGYVMCYSNKTGKYLWKGEFVNGKKTGDFAEYLYDKGFYWSYHINGNEKMWHRLKRLSPDKIENNWLNDDFLTYNETTKSWSGWFLASLVNSNLSSMTRLENVSSYNDIEIKALAKSTSVSGNGNTVKITPNKPAEPQVKRCSHCDGYGATYTYVCSTCNNTGWTNTYIGKNSYSLVRQICGCVGGGMMGYSYMKSTLDSRKKICGYCNGKGVLK
jgi:hypothetical protein